MCSETIGRKETTVSEKPSSLSHTNFEMSDILSIIEQAKFRHNLATVEIAICIRIPNYQRVALKNAMMLPRKLICSLLALRSAQEVKRLAPYSAMKRFPKDLLRMLCNFLK